MTHCSPGILDNATKLTWPQKPSNICRATHFSKDFVGEKCNLENNLHGKTTLTSFLLRSSQIIGSDEESNENSEFSWERNANHSQRSPQNTWIQETTHIKVPGNHRGISKQSTTFGHIWKPAQLVCSILII